MNNRGTTWQENEIEIIVSDYLEMLRLDLEGKKFNKTERYRILQGTLNRSIKAIEGKHRNISAIMEILDLQIVEGLSPWGHYQKRLFEVLVNQLEDRNLLEAMYGQTGEARIPNTGILYNPPPTIDRKFEIIDPNFWNFVEKYDPLRDARNRELGEAGEKYVYDAEKRRLLHEGKDKLSERVRWVSKEDGDGTGYDILSFTSDGDKRWLEVKTTISSKRAGFWITQNELSVSDENPDIYRLVRLFDFKRKPSAFKLKPPLRDHVKLHPSLYHASFKFT
ncbi:MAG: DUF3883 domain-containing protein [Rhodobacteraceae bacterium]|nr:DUF3883 domain-containing protein [Paracoccaceae bacterium]MYF47244.1 DUF3883 domain-containing protein [Paracoccaceae bacterium]MYI90757.1 DUF3883 domain-containing protein [Paracoccaceae bacterium]